MEQSNGSTQAITDLHRIEIGVDWPPGHVAAYLVDGPEPVLVDAGMPGTEQGAELRAGLEAAGRSPEEIEHLVITHPHVDHIGQVSALTDSADPTIYAPSGARERLARDPSDLERAVRRTAAEAGLQGATLDEAVSKSVDSLHRNRELLDMDRVDEWIDDGQRFDAGGLTLEAIHTPGHQADHLCYDTTLNGEAVLFSGDILLEPFRSVMIHAGLDTGVEDGVPAFLGSLDRLEALGERRIYPGHGGAHEDLQATVERSRANIERMVERARQTAVEEGTTALALAARRAGERSFHYVLPEVVSALTHLEARGEIDSTLEDGIRNYHAPE
jgi:glyoxylase-like metal-dependent hydrolase (beta-lactamase superfamily II)